MLKTVATNVCPNEKGNIAIITGIVGLMLATATGAAFDGSRLLRTKGKLQSMADAAALAALKPENISQDQRRQNAHMTVDTHMKNTKAFTLNNVEIAVNESHVDVRLLADVPLLFSALIGDSKRQVAVNSRAEESVSADISSVSVSFVIDLSESMDESLDRKRKVDAVRRSVSNTLQTLTARFGGSDLAEGRISSGVYGYSWGPMESETVPLEPGTLGTIQSISALRLEGGRVPSASIEQASADHIEAIDEDGDDRRHFIVMISDGNVDNDRADQSGRYLSERQTFRSGETAECKAAAEELEQMERALVRHYNHVIDQDETREVRDASGVLVNYIGTVSYIDQSYRGDALLDATQRLLDETVALNLPYCDHINNLGVIFQRQTIKAHENYITACEPVQSKRVVDACMQAREEDVSLIAINLTGEGGPAAPVNNLCAFKDNTKKGRPARDGDPLVETRDETLPSGLKITVSQDGHSMAGAPQNERDLSEMLNTILEKEGDLVRTVRIVG